MNSRIKTVLSIVIFAALIIGAVLLYNSLGKNRPAGGLIIDAGGETANTSDTVSANDDTADGTTVSDTEASESEAEPMHTVAPDFTVIDNDGNEIRLSDKFGKPIVLNFWASWCPPCKAEMPDFNEAYGELGDEVEFMMVNATDGSRETVEKAKKFISDARYEFPVYYDVNYEASYAYGTTSLPMTFFIDENGYLIAHAVGMIDAQTLELGIGMITKK